jgi:DoxX-like protein
MEQFSIVRRNRSITTYALWIVQVLFALIFLFTGEMKLIVPLGLVRKQMPIPLPDLFGRFLGAAGALGAIGLILPGLLRIRMILTALAACGLVIITIGATIYTLSAGGGAAALTPLSIALLATFVAFGGWSRLAA